MICPWCKGKGVVGFGIECGCPPSMRCRDRKVTLYAINVYTNTNDRGPVLRGWDRNVDEADAHDILRDRLHALGVKDVDRAIIEGGPVHDRQGLYEVSWELIDEDYDPDNDTELDGADYPSEGVYLTNEGLKFPKEFE